MYWDDPDRLYIANPGGRVHHIYCDIIRDCRDAVEIPFELSDEQKEKCLCRICCKKELEQIGKQREVSSEKEQPVYVTGLGCCAGDREIEMRLDSVLGVCLNWDHPGMIGRSVARNHNCNGKNCPYFVKNELNPYWEAVEIMEENIAAKADKRRESAEKAREQERKKQLICEELRTEFAAEKDLNIVSLEHLSRNRIIVHYTTDRKEYDLERFLPLLWQIKRKYPSKKFTMVHVKDSNGKYVTTEEFRQIKRSGIYKV